MTDSDLTMRRTIDRMDGDDKRYDWFARHHRLAEQLLHRPAGPIQHPNPHRPVIDYLCADSLTEAKENGGAMWNHAVWVIEQGWHLLNRGENSWWPKLPNTEGATDDPTCPLCNDSCRYQVLASGAHYLAREEAGRPYHPWPFLMDAAQMWFSDHLPGAISPNDGESVGDFLSRHLSTFKVMAEESGGLPLAFTLIVSDALTGDKRHVLYTLERVGSQFYAVRGTFTSLQDLNAWRVEHLGISEPDELDDADIRDRLSVALAAKSRSRRHTRGLIQGWELAKRGRTLEGSSD